MNRNPYDSHKSRVRRWLPLLVIFSVMSLWEIIVRTGWASPIFFPPPSSVVLVFMSMTTMSDMLFASGMTLFRLTMGVIIGGSAGVTIAYIMGFNHTLRAAFDPIVVALHPLPKISLFPFFIVLLGIGESSKISLVALTAFFPVLINTLAAIQQIDRSYWEVARNYGATNVLLLRRIILPGSLPMTITGLRLGINSALAVTVAVEMLSAHHGLGAQIWLAWQTLRMEELYATLLVISLIGLGVNYIMTILTKRLLPWHN